MVVLLGPGKVKNIIIVLHQENLFVLFIMGIILMVASLVIVDFDIKKKMNIIRICVYSCLLLQSFLRITSLFLIFKSTVQICVVTQVVFKIK